MKPNFFIIGAPKCGTTSIHAYLDAHPQVFMSSPKELNYFSGEQIRKQKLYYDANLIQDENEYLSVFKNAEEEKVVGEASVSYLYYSDVAARVFEFNPNAKLLVVLRDPVKRAFSHYLMDYKLGLVKYTFKEIFENREEENYKLYFQQYFELGEYYTQLKRYFDLFPKNQVKIYLQEDLKDNLDEVMKNLAVFLQIEDDKLPDLSHSYNVYVEPKNILIGKLFKSSIIRRSLKTVTPVRLINWIKKQIFTPQKPPSIEEKLERQIKNYYLQSIEKTGKLIGKDLSSWY